MADNYAPSNYWKIVYHTNYGTAPNVYYTDVSVTGNLTVTSEHLPVLTYPYATFWGWYTTETFDEDSKVEIGDLIGSDEDQAIVNGATIYDGTFDFYAKWEPTERHLVAAMDVYALAEAVRAKAGTTAGILPQDIPAAIRALAGG